MKRNRWDSSDSEEEEEDNATAKLRRSAQQHSNRETPLTESNEEEVEDDSTGGRSPLVHNFYHFGCRSVESYERLSRIDEGTYGVVSKARDKKSGDIVALKQVKMSADVCKEGFPVTALREINVLLALRHPNIVRVREMVVGSSADKIFMVMDYAENDLKHIMETKVHQPFLQSEVKYLMKSLLSAVSYMHDHWYIHRDLKTSNLLYDASAALKVCDFGLARHYGSPIRKYTQLVVTLWYRSPELLLGAKTYSTAVDMWSVGCIFAEILTLKPLFPGRGELDQMDQIFRLLGSPSEKTWPDLKELPNAQNIRWKWPKQSRLREKFPTSSFAGGCSLSNAGFDLLSRLLTLDPKQRISAKEALRHEYFTEFPPPKAQELMPTFPSG